MSEVNMWVYEAQCSSEGMQLICGDDEAGRRALAGPVWAAAVILPENVQIRGLNDSKKLTDKRRRAMMPVIRDLALAYAVVMVE